MSNTIRRPRKRPRVRSCNFRAFWWLVRREAAWNIRRGVFTSPPEHDVRRHFMLEPWPTCAARAQQVIHFNESRRYYP